MEMTVLRIEKYSSLSKAIYSFNFTSLILPSKNLILTCTLIIHICDWIQANVAHLIMYQKGLHGKRKSSGCFHAPWHEHHVGLLITQGELCPFLLWSTKQSVCKHNRENPSRRFPHTKIVLVHTFCTPSFHFTPGCYHTLTLDWLFTSLLIWVVSIGRYFRVFNKVFLYQKEEKMLLFVHFISCSIYIKVPKWDELKEM